MIKFIIIMITLCCLSCASFQPAITEGRIVKKYTDIDYHNTGFPEHGFSGATFINIKHFIVISDGNKRQLVRVTTEEYEGLQKGMLVDVSKKFK